MKFNRILIIAILLLIFAIGAVSASEDVNTTDDVVSTDNVEELSADDDDEDDDGEDYDDEYSIEFPDIVEDEYDTIDVELLSDTNGKLTVNVNNTPYKLKKVVDEDDDTYIRFDDQGKYELSLNDDADPYFSIVLSTLPSGIYNINVNFTTAAKTYSDSANVDKQYLT